MSWFEATAIASIAKNAFKEAQKRIDEALDIREEQNSFKSKDEFNTLSSNVKKQLKEESDNFFANFGVSESSEDVISKDPKEGSSQRESKDDSGRLVGSIWGSFTGSFFDNSKTETKEKACNKASSAPVTPSDAVVATQPPRSLSNLSDLPTVEDSSTSSSIVQISVDTISPSPGNSAQSPFLEEINGPIFQTENDLCKSEEFGSDNRNFGWEWGWDSSIMALSTSSKQNEDIFPSKNDSLYQEESLADDTFDTEGFAKSRLIVGSVDSESSSVRHESLGSIASNRSQPELDSLAPVIEEVFFDENDVVPLLMLSSFASENERNTFLGYKLDLDGLRPSELTVPEQLESPDSIIVLDSTITSPVEPSSLDILCKPSMPVLNLHSITSSPESIEVIEPAESPISPSSIEVLSGTSTEISSPATQDTSHTVSDDTVSSITIPSDKSPESDSKNVSSETQEKSWRASQEDVETQAITKQPKKILADERDFSWSEQTYLASGNDIGMVMEEAKESFHSSTTSSSTMTILDATDSQDHSNLILSMNAGDIRKHLEDVDKDGRLDGKYLPGNVKETEEGSFVKKEEELLVDLSQSSTAILEMSSRSESSTDTVTASIESQHMTWSDLTTFEVQSEDVDLATKTKEEQEADFQDMLVDSATKTKEEQEADLQDMLEDAMDDNQETEVSKEETLNEAPSGVDSSANVERELSPSSSDRSDVQKVSSSGHSSGDEIETATSSDIEVISSPSMDGSSNGNSRATFNMTSSVGSKVWLSAQKGLRTFMNDKAEAMSSHAAHSSGSKNGNGYSGETVPSSMTTSFTSISESEGDSPHLPHSELLQLEASRITQILLQDIDAREMGHRRNKSNHSETSESSSEPQTPEVEKLLKKINYLTDVLESRETKVLELSHMNASVQELNSNLKSRLDELEGLRKGSENPEFLREEYTQRMSVMERKFQQALKEKENVKKLLEEYKTEAASRRSNADVLREMEEKETVIAELRKEGEKLSKQQLTYSNTIKRLRTKEKESDTCIKDQKEKIESLSIELDRLRKTLKAKDEMERRQIDAVRQLTIATQRQDEETKTLKAENAELEGKISSLKEALDTAYREMSELQRSAASKDAEAQKASLSAEVSAREKVENALTEVQKQNKKEQGALLAQIHELQDTISQTELQYNRKERQLKGEIQDLQQRLSEAESRTDEISNSVSAATRPLLRQMENLQATQKAQQIAWESMEESLTKRLHEAQNAATSSAKREREAKEHLSSTMTEISALQSQIASLQSENAQLKAKLDVVTLKTTTLEEAKARDAQQLEALKNSFAEEISDIKHERDILEQQLEIERTAVGAEKKRSASYQEQLKERDKKLTQMQLVAQAGESRISTPRSSPTPSLSRLSISGSVNDSFAGSHWGDDVFDPSWGRNNSVYDALRGNSAATVDALTSALRQREGEVHHLQSELTRLEAHKESLAHELVQSSRQSEEYLLKVKELEELQEKQKDLEQNYNALLQMYGEKVEEVEELRLDLEDVKEMYKLQIDQLMKT